MRYRKLGKTGLKVSELGLGTAQLGGPSMIGGKLSGFKKMPDKEERAILSFAVDNGVNFIDTGDIYGGGKAEEIIGETLEGSDDTVIATKCGLTKGGTHNFSPDYIYSALEGSLKRLRRDCVDVFQLTKPGMKTIKEGKIFGVFDRLKAEGKIRFSGVSVGTIQNGEALIGKVDSLQIFYNILDRSFEGLIEKAGKAGMGVIIRSPLSTGLLTGKITKETKFEEYDYRKSFLTEDELQKRLGQIDDIMNDYGITRENLTETAFAFILKNKNVSTIIAGASGINQIRENVEIFNRLGKQ